jgi:hypothetical protein
MAIEDTKHTMTGTRPPRELDKYHGQWGFLLLDNFCRPFLS